MSDLENCPLCDHQTAKITKFGNFQDRYECTNCGNFIGVLIPSKWLMSEKYKDRRYILSGVVRNLTDKGEMAFLHQEDIEKYFSYADVPKNPIEAINKILLFIHKKSKSMNEFIRIKFDSEYTIFYLKDYTEFLYLLKLAEGMDFLEKEPGSTNKWRLKMKGWEKIDELLKNRLKSNNAFVAMSFAAEQNVIFTEAIKPALEDTGFLPIRMDIVEHNNLIDDEMIYQIKNSSLLIVDFTKHNPGAYFESGFALGLGIPVIWLCQKEDFKERHFDTEHYNHIKYDNADDLKTKLTIRILATIPNAIKKTNE
ncbi:MAG: hypothetical protein JXD23_08095 [Spirochaetales bacterium]|nr:hypothetical protein [Spirochaetales bacterium]